MNVMNWTFPQFKDNAGSFKQASRPVINKSVNFLSRMGFQYFSFFYAERDLSMPVANIQTKDPLRAEVADENTLEEIRSRINRMMWPSFDHDCQVSTCYVARLDDEIAGFAWLRYHGSMHLSEMYTNIHPLEEGVCYTHHSFVFPKYRSRGVFCFLLHYQYVSARNRGYRYVTNLIERNNYASLKAHSVMGHRFQNVRIFILPGNPGHALNLGLNPSW